MRVILVLMGLMLLGGCQQTKFCTCLKNGYKTNGAAATCREYCQGKSDSTQVTYLPPTPDETTTGGCYHDPR